MLVVGRKNGVWRAAAFSLPTAACCCCLRLLRLVVVPLMLLMLPLSSPPHPPTPSSPPPPRATSRPPPSLSLSLHQEDVRSLVYDCSGVLSLSLSLTHTQSRWRPSSRLRNTHTQERKLARAFAERAKDPPSLSRPANENKMEQPKPSPSLLSLPPGGVEGLCFGGEKGRFGRSVLHVCVLGEGPDSPPVVRDGFRCSDCAAPSLERALSPLSPLSPLSLRTTDRLSPRISHTVLSLILFLSCPTFVRSLGGCSSLVEEPDAAGLVLILLSRSERGDAQFLSNNNTTVTDGRRGRYISVLHMCVR